MGSALFLFDRMIEKDVVSWTSVMNGFVRGKQFAKAFWVFEKMIEFSVKPSEATYVNALSCCANLEKQGGFYQGRQIHGEVCTWNAMISSLACNGREKEALDLFEKMKEDGMCPNEVTFVAVLTACARTKRMELGLQFFQSMWCQYGIVPIMEHYGCM
ncbi:hypothetical protein Gohar_019117, partial [Gossypium harknessii]|nr:hypothetical protein [Gossypium harknessii]